MFISLPPILRTFQRLKIYYLTRAVLLHMMNSYKNRFGETNFARHIKRSLARLQECT